MSDADLSPGSSKDNAWRKANAIAGEAPAQAAKIARELIGGDVGDGVEEEVVRSLLSIISDPTVFQKTPVVKCVADIVRTAKLKAHLVAEGGMQALAGTLCGADEGAKTHAAQILMNIGRSDDATHAAGVDACLEQLRDEENNVKTKISVCRVLNVIMLYDGGTTIVARGGIVDIARVLSEDKTWDSFAVKTLNALADGTSKRDAEIVNALLDVAAGSAGGSGKLRGNLARLLSILSAKQKTSVLQSRSGVHTAIPVVVDLLKEEEDAARAYATECLLNICRGGARLSEPDGTIQDLERVSAYVIFALMKLMQDAETDSRVTAKSFEKVCRILSDLLVDKNGCWRTSTVWSEKELVSNLGTVVAETEGPGSTQATVWAVKALTSGLAGDPASQIIQTRKKMMQTTLAESLRWAMHDGEASRDARCMMMITRLMEHLGVDTNAGALGLDYHIKVIRKNVRLPHRHHAHSKHKEKHDKHRDNHHHTHHHTPSTYLYDGEKGRRIFHAMQKIREALSADVGTEEFDNAVFAVCETGVLGHMVALLDEKADKYNQLEFETLWCLTNICSGSTEQTRSVIEAGAVPAMVRLLNSADKEVQDQALWALANIAGDSGYARDVIISCGVVDAVQAAHASGILHNEKSMIDLTFMVQNIMRTKPLPHIDETKGLVPILGNFLKHIHPHEDSRIHDPTKMTILSQALWGLSGFTSQDEHGELSMDIIMDEGIVPIVVNILRNNIRPQDSGRITGDKDIILPSSRILGNFCCGSDAHTQTVVDIGGIDLMFSITRFPDDTLQKEAWYTLSNVGAGSEEQVETLIRMGVFSRAFDILSENDWSFDGSGTKHKDTFFFGAPQAVKAEIVWLVMNTLPEDDSQEELLSRQTMMTKVLSSRHSQAGQEHDEEDLFHGVTALFEAVSAFVKEIVMRKGDVEHNVEMATKLMTALKTLTSDRCLYMNEGIRVKLKEKGKRLVGILRDVLRQPGNIARMAEDITEQIIMHL